MALNREKVVRNAEKYVSKGKLEAAIKEYRKVLRENPNDTSTLNRVGDLYARLERFDEAVRLFSQIAEKYTDDGFFVKAIAIYKKIIKFDPSALSVYERLAELYHRQGLPNEARSQYQFLAEYYLKNNNLTTATTIYQRMAELEPKNPSYRLKLAELYEQQRFPDKSVREYEALAAIMLDAESPDEAAHVYKKALELQAENLDLVRSSVKELRDRGYTGAAAKVLAHAVDLNPAAASLAREMQLEESAADEVSAEAREVVEGAEETDATQSGDVATPEAESKTDDTFELPETSFDLDAAAEEAMAAIDAADDSGYAEDVTGAGFGDLDFEVRLDDEPLPDEGAVAEIDADFQSMEDELAADLGDEPVEIGDEPEDGFGEVELEVELEGFDETVNLAEVDLAAEEIEAEKDLTDQSYAVAEEEATDAQPVRREEDLLAEAKVFSKYGLAEKARDRLGELLEVNPQHLESLQLLARMELEAGDTEAATTFARRLAAASLEAEDSDFYDLLRGDFAAEGLALDAVDVPAAPAVLGLADDETVISATPQRDAKPEPEPVAETTLAPSAPAPLPEFESGPEPVAKAAPELEPGGVKPTVRRRAKSKDRIAQLLDDLSLDGFDAPAQEPKRAKAEPTPMPAAPMPAAPEPAAEAPVVEEPVAPEPAPAPTAAEGGRLFSLKDELDLGGLVDPEEDEAEPVSAFAGEDADDHEFDFDADAAVPVPAAPEAPPQDDLDESGMSWLQDEAPTPVAASAGDGGDDLDSLFDEEDDFFDLAAELEAELGSDGMAQMDQGVSSLESQEGTLEEIIEGFKQGVAEHLSDEDYDTHFSLGIAYREMGLLDEAIGEFQLASKDVRHLADSAGMLGMCFTEKGLPELAVRWYKKGLESPQITEDTTLGLLYDLASTYESTGEPESAYRTFVEIYGINTNFRDVAGKMRELAPQKQA